MGRNLLVAAAQMGPMGRNKPRAAVVKRLADLLRESASRGAELVVFPEAALTPFFPHWEIDDPNELDSYFEQSMPNKAVQPLFGAAKALGVGFYLGYTERTSDDEVHYYNSSVLVERNGEVVGHYRKIHLPGYVAAQPEHPFQNLEKRYFEVGNLGFPVWDAFSGRVGMCICNDRRWPRDIPRYGTG